jgi:hypothetical protein
MSWPALELDFVARPRRRPLAGFVLLAAALALTGGQVSRYADTLRQLERLKAAQVLLGDARPAPAIPRQRLDEQVKQAQAVLRQLALPWSQMVESLESAAMPGVAVLQVQPDAQQRVLRVTAETQTQEAMLDYLRRVGAARTFGDVHLVSHQVHLEDARQPIQFALQATLKSTP